jgi:hypothetical protein
MQTQSRKVEMPNGLSLPLAASSTASWYSDPDVSPDGEVFTANLEPSVHHRDSRLRYDAPWDFL